MAKTDELFIFFIKFDYRDYLLDKGYEDWDVKFIIDHRLKNILYARKIISTAPYLMEMFPELNEIMNGQD